MFGYTRFDVGYCDWRGLVGATGTRETINVGSNTTEDTDNTDNQDGE